jgi:uncharacterized protein YqjF (DUF2071 family)
VTIAYARSRVGRACAKGDAPNGSRIHYASVHADRSFVASYEPVGPTVAAERGSLEERLVERYRLFALRAGELVTAEVTHSPWLLQPADAAIELNTLAPPGLALAGPPLLHFSRGVDAAIGPPCRVRRLQHHRGHERPVPEVGRAARAYVGSR